MSRWVMTLPRDAHSGRYFVYGQMEVGDGTLSHPLALRDEETGSMLTFATQADAWEAAMAWRRVLERESEAGQP